MTATVVFLVLLALVVIAVERNHARQRYHGRVLAGGGTATDRDAERVAADLESAHEAAPQHAVRAGTVMVGRPVTR